MIHKNSKIHIPSLIQCVHLKDLKKEQMKNVTYPYTYIHTYITRKLY